MFAWGSCWETCEGLSAKWCESHLAKTDQRSSMETDGNRWKPMEWILWHGQSWLISLDYRHMDCRWWDSRIALLCHRGPEFAVQLFLDTLELQPRWYKASVERRQKVLSWEALWLAWARQGICICLCDSFSFAALKTMDLKTGLENQPALLFKLKMDSERFAWPQTGNTSAKPADAFSLAFVLAKRRSHESSVYDTMICYIVYATYKFRIVQVTFGHLIAKRLRITRSKCLSRAVFAPMAGIFFGSPSCFGSQILQHSNFWPFWVSRLHLWIPSHRFQSLRPDSPPGCCNQVRSSLLLHETKASKEGQSSLGAVL